VNGSPFTSEEQWALDILGRTKPIAARKLAIQLELYHRREIVLASLNVGALMDRLIQVSTEYRQKAQSVRVKQAERAELTRCADELARFVMELGEL
jgi:hypothetical protein